MFCDAEDGAAIVSHIPISPFVPIQHNSIDVSAVNRLANFAIRFAREHGWCSSHPFKMSSGPKIGENEGESNELDDITVFYAGVEVELAEETPKFKREGTPASLFLYAQLWLSHVGVSSNGLYGKLFSFKKDEEDCREFLGSFKLTGVTVSRTTRKPTPIPAPRLEMMRSLIAKNTAASELPRVERINFSQLNERCRFASVRSHEEFACALPSHPAVAPLKVGYRREFHLRETDFDFNRHVNQVVTITMVINTFRAALGDNTTVFPRLLDTDVHPLDGDLLIRRLRIDYVREVPADHTAIAVMLFFQDDVSMDNVIASSTNSRKKSLTELWFIVQGIPAAETNPFVSAVGKVLLRC